jgi:hypothetical protein
MKMNGNTEIGMIVDTDDIRKHIGSWTDAEPATKLLTYDRRTDGGDMFYRLVHHLAEGNYEVAELGINRNRKGKIYNIGLGVLSVSVPISHFAAELKIVTDDHHLNDGLPAKVETDLAALGYIDAT